MASLSSGSPLDSLREKISTRLIERRARPERDIENCLAVHSLGAEKAHVPEHKCAPVMADKRRALQFQVIE